MSYPFSCSSLMAARSCGTEAIIIKLPNVSPPLPQLRAAIKELRDGGADVRQLDDVGLRALSQLAQLRKVVGEFLRRGQVIREVGDDPAGEGDVPRLELDAGTLGVGPNDREQSVARQRRRLVDLGPDDLCCCHGPSSWQVFFAATRRGSLALLRAGCQVVAGRTG